MTLSEREQLLRRIRSKLGDRKLVWFGTRGEDALTLLDLPQLQEVFSLIAPINAVSIDVDISLETLTKCRVDLDSYNLDRDNGLPAQELRRKFFASLGEPAVVVPYRPLAFLSSVQFPRMEYVTVLGLFHERQAPFEHKPWVEAKLKAIGINMVPWRYVTDASRQLVQEQLESRGAIVLRENRSDGGAGLTLIQNEEELAAAWGPVGDGFLSFAPVLSPHVPLNVNACVFRDGSVTIHTPSVQLLGLPSCTKRIFGYCGNDFGVIKQLVDKIHLDELQHAIQRIARWLATAGYIGAFGVDAMIYQDALYIVEINPRFQGSSALSASIDAEYDRPDVFLAHMAAFLDIEVASTPCLRDLVECQSEAAQIIVHNICGQAKICTSPSFNGSEDLVCGLLPEKDIKINPEGIVCRLTTNGSVTTDGFSLHQDFEIGDLFHDNT